MRGATCPCGCILVLWKLFNTCSYVFFWALIRPDPGSRPSAGGVQRYFRFANYYLKKNKTTPADRHLGPLLPPRRRYTSRWTLLHRLHYRYQSHFPKFRVPKPNCFSICTDPVPEPVQMHIPLWYLHQQVCTPLDRTPKVVLGCSQA